METLLVINAVFALYHDPRFAEPFVPDDTVDIVEYQHNRESDIYLYPNPTNGKAVVCGYMYDYRSIELFDLQGRKISDLAESHDGTYLPIIDLTPYRCVGLLGESGCVISITPIASNGSKYLFLKRVRLVCSKARINSIADAKKITTFLRKPTRNRRFRAAAR